MKEKHSVVKAILMVSQIGISMIVPIFLGAFIGYQFDRLFKTEFCILIFLVLGIAAAFRNIYKLTKPFYAEDLKREQKEQAYWESLLSRNDVTRQPEEDPAGTGGESGGVQACEEEPVSGVRARRLRQQSDVQKKLRGAPGDVVVKSGSVAAEEEFKAWRKRREENRKDE